MFCQLCVRTRNNRDHVESSRTTPSPTYGKHLLLHSPSSFAASRTSSHFSFFFFNDPAPPEISTLPLPDALPISPRRRAGGAERPAAGRRRGRRHRHVPLQRHRRQRVALGAVARRHVGSPGHPRRVVARDRKSTRLNSSHSQISYAVFCLKKKKQH